MESEGSTLSLVQANKIVSDVVSNLTGMVPADLDDIFSLTKQYIITTYPYFAGAVDTDDLEVIFDVLQVLEAEHLKGGMFESDVLRSVDLLNNHLHAILMPVNIVGDDFKNYVNDRLLELMRSKSGHDFDFILKERAGWVIITVDEKSGLATLQDIKVDSDGVFTFSVFFPHFKKKDVFFSLLPKEYTERNWVSLSPASDSGNYCLSGVSEIELVDILSNKNIINYHVDVKYRSKVDSESQDKARSSSGKSS